MGPQLEVLWKRNYSVYGRRKLTKAAHRAGIDAGRDQVARLMAVQGIRGASRAKKRFTTRADPDAVRAPDLVNRNFTASRPDQLWVADFTYCSTWSGIVYVAFIVDVYSRRLVGWKAARSMTTPLVLDALNMAAWTRRHESLEELICHTDAGSQYTSIAYTERLADIGAAPSIGTVGDSFDNAWVESFNGRMRDEHLNGQLFDNLFEAQVLTEDWRVDYNEERPRSAHGWKTPAEFATGWITAHQPSLA